MGTEMTTFFIWYGVVSVIAMVICWFEARRDFTWSPALRLFICFVVGIFWLVAGVLWIVDKMDLFKNVR